MDRFAVHRTTAFGLEERQFLGDGVVTGYGRIDGRQVFLFCRTSPYWADRSAK